MSQRFFLIRKISKISRARLTTLITPHGRLEGPFFMPIGTRGTVKNLSSEDLKMIGAQIVLANTYHLFLRPGLGILKKAESLGRFIGWSGPILTDSGGYQVFSLSDLRKIQEQGVSFRDPQNGENFFLSPQKAIQIQKILGSDILMTLDECPPFPCSRQYAQKSLRLTTRWAEKCKREFDKDHVSVKKFPRSLIFGIIQGSIYEDLRRESARQIASFGLDGYAVGGVAVGEPPAMRHHILQWVLPLLPEDKPRYLMGVGRPEEIVSAVKHGMDMFDCVIPTREARHGKLYIWKRASGFSYRTLHITNSRYSRDFTPIDNSHLHRYTYSYLHYLFKTKEPLGPRLATIHNLTFYLELMQKIREGIRRGDI